MGQDLCRGGSGRFKQTGGFDIEMLSFVWEEEPSNSRCSVWSQWLQEKVISFKILVNARHPQRSVWFKCRFSNYFQWFNVSVTPVTFSVHTQRFICSLWWSSGLTDVFKVHRRGAKKKIPFDAQHISRELNIRWEKSLCGSLKKLKCRSLGELPEFPHALVFEVWGDVSH